MLALARQAAGIAVDRWSRLPEEDAWDGEFSRDLSERLAEDAPEDGRPAAEVLERAARDILPIGLRLDHPRCFAFIPTAPTWPSIVADFMASAYSVNACTWLVASGASQTELVVVDWFRRWIGYPEGAGGLITSGGSAASLNALVVAREAAGYPENATVYMSDQSHGAIIRAAATIGIRRERIRIIPSDDLFRIDMDALARSVAEDRAAGANPIAVVATAGTSSSGAIDPLEAMADFCGAQGIWLHVDAAYGGFALLAEKGKQALRGVEKADSIGLDAHKWFFQPYEAGGLLVKDERKLVQAFGVRADVLQDTIWGKNHPNFSDRSFEVSRSFRAFKIWMSVQTFGLRAFRGAVSRAMELAERAEGFVQASPVLEMSTPLSLSIACFRVNPVDANLDEATIEDANRTVLARVFWEDRAFISSTILHGTFCLRLCILNDRTSWEDVRKTLEVIERFGREYLDRVSQQ